MLRAMLAAVSEDAPNLLFVFGIPITIVLLASVIGYIVYKVGGK
jgi:hypothetical protein